MNDKNIDPLIILPILKKIPLFANLDENLHREIIGRIILMYYPANHVIFKEGDEGDALYIVKKGTVEIVRRPGQEGGDVHKIADINDGGFFGEMALVSDEPRNATARTLTDCESFILSKEDFKKLLDSNPALAEQISATMVSRIKENENK